MCLYLFFFFFFFSSRRRHTRWNCDWSSDVCSSDLLIRELDELARVLRILRVIRDPDADREVTAGLAITVWQVGGGDHLLQLLDRKSTRLNSSHSSISYAVFCLKKKKT